MSAALRSAANPASAIGDRPRSPGRVENHGLSRPSVGARAADVFVGNRHGDQLAPREQGRRGGERAMRAVRLVVADHDGTDSRRLALLREEGVSARSARAPGCSARPCPKRCRARPARRSARASRPRRPPAAASRPVEPARALRRRSRGGRAGSASQPAAWASATPSAAIRSASASPSRSSSAASSSRLAAVRSSRRRNSPLANGGAHTWTTCAAKPGSSRAPISKRVRRIRGAVVAHEHVRLVAAMRGGTHRLSISEYRAAPIATPTVRSAP